MRLYLFRVLKLQKGNSMRQISIIAVDRPVRNVKCTAMPTMYIIKTKVDILDWEGKIGLHKWPPTMSSCAVILCCIWEGFFFTHFETDIFCLIL